MKNKNSVIAFLLIGCICAQADGIPFRIINFLQTAVNLKFDVVAANDTHVSVNAALNPGEIAGAGKGVLKNERGFLFADTFGKNKVRKVIISGEGFAAQEHKLDTMTRKEIVIRYKQPLLADLAFRLRRCSGLLQSSPEVLNILKSVQHALADVTVEVR